MKLDRIAELETLALSGTQGKKSDAIRECLGEIQRLQARKEAAKGPSLHDVMVYAEEIGLNSGEPEKFFDHFKARGWKMGRTASAPMRDFKAAMRNWKRNCTPVNGTPKPTNTYGVG